MLCVILERCHFALTYLPEVESAGVNVSEHMFLLLFDRFLELYDGLGTRNIEKECMIRIITLYPTEKTKCCRHGGQHGGFSFNASG
jgi:hypothetical protein